MVMMWPKTKHFIQHFTLRILKWVVYSAMQCLWFALEPQLESFHLQHALVFNTSWWVREWNSALLRKEEIHVCPDSQVWTSHKHSHSHLFLITFITTLSINIAALMLRLWNVLFNYFRLLLIWSPSDFPSSTLFSFIARSSPRYHMLIWIIPIKCGRKRILLLLAYWDMDE